MTSVGLEAGQRYRCAACGNLTRFDVETVERVRRFWHADLSGDGVVDDEQRVEFRVESVSCRWCGTGQAVEVVDAPGASGRSPTMGHAAVDALETRSAPDG